MSSHRPISRRPVNLPAYEESMPDFAITGIHEFFVGGRDRNHLSLTPLRRNNPGVTTFWDGNWLTVAVEVRGGIFSGRFEADLRADEFQDFQLQLEALRGATGGTATLESVESWVRLELTVDEQGRLHGDCEVRDDPTRGSRLRFGLGSDQVQLLDMLDGLKQILEAFPPVGNAEEEANAGFPAFDEPEPA
jgi:hypothetical protein